MKSWKIVVALFFLPLMSFGQECSSQWDMYFDTNPLHPKYLSGDTATGYAVFSYWGNADIAFEIHGEYPRSRFMSFETEATRLAISEDHLFDASIDPDPGSENPFREGVNLDTPNRAFRIYAMQDASEAAPNTIRLPEGRLSQAIMYRIYSPNEGVSLSKKDLPRVFAYDRKTGTPTNCPRSATYDPQFHFPQILANIYAAVAPFEFKVPDKMQAGGLNQASGYMFAVTSMKNDQVVVARFQAPTFTNTRSGKGNFTNGEQVRYWSFCANNFPKNQTLNCVPDYLAKPDSNGEVTVVFGGGEEVKAAAESRGFSYLPDTRKWSQRVIGFVYRNLVPEAGFKETQMYQGKYIPTAALCSADSFLAETCR